MIVLYRLRVIRATPLFYRVVGFATLGVVLTYSADLIMGLFGHSLPLIHQSTTGGILFSLAVVVIASLNFILDFDMVERGVSAQAPKYMEWYAGFSILVTIIWLYLELLRLLNKRR